MLSSKNSANYKLERNERIYSSIVIGNSIILKLPRDVPRITISTISMISKRETSDLLLLKRSLLIYINITINSIVAKVFLDTRVSNNFVVIYFITTNHLLVKRYDMLLAI
jgi:hypothetical protein